MNKKFMSTFKHQEECTKALKDSNGTCMLTFESAKMDTPPATRNVQKYSGRVYLIP